MRSEHEMLHTILHFAQEDERVRAVILNGSRANPHAPRDIFQDYDIVFLVSSMDSFIQERRWINHFGELIIMQTPDEHMEPIPMPRDRFAFLMLFTDGNRIDLTLYPANNIANWTRDSLSVLLLDKDGLVEPFPPPVFKIIRRYLQLPKSMRIPATSFGGSVLMWLKGYGDRSYPMPNLCWIGL